MSKNYIRICVLLIMMTYSVESQDVVYALVQKNQGTTLFNQVRKYPINPPGDGNPGYDIVYDVGNEESGTLSPFVYDSAENTLYWMYDGEFDRFEKYDLDDQSHAVISTNLEKYYSSMAIDPTERKIYCGGYNAGIDVFGMDDETIVISPYLDIQKLSDLDVENGYLYMLTSSHIQRVRLDDDMLEVEVIIETQSPIFALTRSKVYWQEYLEDDGLNVFQEADLDGLNKREIPGDVALYDLEVHENSMFGTNFGTTGIDRIEIDTGDVTTWTAYEENVSFAHILIKRDTPQCTLSCLNEGDCVLNEDQSEVCKCKKGYTGPTCKRQTAYCCPELLPEE